jgi:hypothetical protein
MFLLQGHGQKGTLYVMCDLKHEKGLKSGDLSKDLDLRGMDLFLYLRV